MCLNVTISNIIVQVACVAVQLLVPEIATHVPGKIGFLIELCDFFIKTILIYMYKYLIITYSGTCMCGSEPECVGALVGCVS